MARLRLPVQSWIAAANKKLFEPKPTIAVVYIRFVLYGFFVWKLLSRDYRVFGLAEPETLEAYGRYGYPEDLHYVFLGFPWLVDLATFHWVHWIIPLPNYAALSVVYFGTIALCVLCIVAGSGRCQIFAILAYAGLSYLWGFNWRTGADIDAVFIQLQMAMLFVFYSGANPPVWAVSRADLQYGRDAGWFYSMVILIFVGYYTLSGWNKITDISLIDWFTYDLVQEVRLFYHRYLLGAPISIPTIVYEWLAGWEFLGALMVPAVYLSHLAIVAMFFSRRLILKFLVFYWLFHFITSALGIWFSGLLVIWLALVPVHRLFVPLNVRLEGPESWVTVWSRRISRLDFRGMIHVEAVPTGGPPHLQAYATGSVDRFEQARGIRRIAWSAPAIWPLLPLFYVPPISTVVWKLMRIGAKPPVRHDNSAEAVIIYDGLCPFCSNYVRWLRLGAAVGTVRLVNARDGGDDATRAQQLGHDLNEGMVLVLGGRFYHGADCINRLALLSTGSGVFNAINAGIFRSESASLILYPFLRAGRNATLWLLGRPPISQARKRQS